MRIINSKSLLISLTTILVVSCSPNPEENQDFSGQNIPVEAEKQGTTLLLSGLVPAGVHEVELRIESDRNNDISHIKEVSANHPRREEQITANDNLPGNIYYPVVDIVLERGMEGMAGFENCGGKDSCIINGPFYKRKQDVRPWVIIPSNVLQSWENSVFISSGSCYLNTFYIRKRYPVVTRQLDIRIRLLSGQWGGTVSLYDVKNEAELFSEKILPGDYSAPAFTDGEDLSRDRLLKALEGCVDFTQRSQMKDPGHFCEGGLFLFYDLDARLHRSCHWAWGWGPSVTMLLKASEVIKERKEELTRTAGEIGEATLRFLWKDPGSLMNDMMISRWGRGLSYKDGYYGGICVGDALFVAGWAWIPLYESTGDERYLDAAVHHCRVTDQLLDEWLIIPHDYLIDEDGWNDWVVDETGFGMEGYAETYRITPEKALGDGGRVYIERHLEVFERPDGLWNKRYHFQDSSVTPANHIVRGLGWATEGLLAAHRLLPGEGYLDKAKRLADHLVESQQPEGYWSFMYDKPVAEVGITEKGTALWSYLFYSLYQATGEKVYLDTGRKALRWCMNVQYDGTDPQAYGSIPGCTSMSAVGYRPWFNVSCTYTTAFMGLAILHELSLK